MKHKYLFDSIEDFIRQEIESAKQDTVEEVVEIIEKLKTTGHTRKCVEGTEFCVCNVDIYNEAINEILFALTSHYKNNK